MADTAVASGLMPHQKDEHDIWTCRNCGWKYPNAKPSPKIRNHHKKQCPGKAGAETHAPGGSSDDVSDDDHHSPLQGSMAAKEVALDAPVPQVETKSRDLDFASVKEDLKSEAAPATAPVVNGTTKEVANGAAKDGQAQKEATNHSAAIVSSGGLMPHQKDEHDIWICRACGWKYPNARPSPKIRKHHKRHCPGKGGAVAAGGSSDEASDDEHHHSEHHHGAAPPPVAVESEENGSSATPPEEAPTSISREIDLAPLQTSPSPEVTKTTPTAEIPPDASNGTLASSEPASLENAVFQQPPVETPPAVEHEKEDPATDREVPRTIFKERNFTAPKKPSIPVVKKKTTPTSPGKTSPAVPGRKRTTPLQTNVKPPWRY
ncbi:unnamed protein product [Calypogeia fissa]